MAPEKSRTTPGVYITELNAFPTSVVGVPTAVPAFIGYTEMAEYNGKQLANQPIAVSSMVDFETYFGKGYQPIYAIKEQQEPQGDFQSYSLKANRKFYLYDSIRLFYANGGGNCYVVSVGNYDQGSAIQASDLLRGLAVIKQQSGPTMLVIPDAMRLNAADYQTVTRAMLQQAADLQDRVAILDVYGSLSVVDQPSMDAVITQFRAAVGEQNLSYGMAYFPWLNTTLVRASDYTYMNLSPIGPIEQAGTLQAILEAENQRLYATNSAQRDQITKEIQGMSDPIGQSNTMRDVVLRHQNLCSAIPLLAEIMSIVANRSAVLPPSGAIAGIYTTTDNQRGVWQAPANVAPNAVSHTTFPINDAQQSDLNVPVDGKAVNALRDFPGRGTLVWGARTLDGNSNDWRYIQVRRTIIYIEQSIKTALHSFVFAPNDANTWAAVTAMLSDFLANLWQQGGLMGAKASDAYAVQCGLGSTMTGQDILQGDLIVQVSLALTRPNEFIGLTFKQQVA